MSDGESLSHSRPVDGPSGQSSRRSSTIALGLSWLRAFHIRLKSTVIGRLPQSPVGAIRGGLPSAHGPPWTVESSPLRRYGPLSCAPSPVPTLIIGGGPAKPRLTRPLGGLGLGLLVGVPRPLGSGLHQPAGPS